jgi:hypothetical protein
MNQQEFIKKVQEEAKKRVNQRIGVLRNELDEAFRKVTGKVGWYSSDGGDIRKDIIEAYFNLVRGEWPKSLYEEEERNILDGLLGKPDGKELKTI